MNGELSRRGFMRNITAASLAAFFAGKVSASVNQVSSVLAPAFDYRRVRWGMSHSEVLAAEDTAAYLCMPACIMYHQTLDQLPLTLNYQFTEQGGDLVCLGAVLQTDLSRNSFYVDMVDPSSPRTMLNEAKCDYARIKEVLGNEYGAAVAQDVPYHDEELVEALLSRGNDNHQQELSAGVPSGIDKIFRGLSALSHDEKTIRSLMVQTTWATSRTKISLLLIPQPYGGVALTVGHVSIEHVRLAEGKKSLSESP